MTGASEGTCQPAAQGDGTALLAQFLSDPDPAMRLEATRALAKLGPAAAVAVPGLITTLKDRNVKLRLAALTALGAVGSAAVPAIPALAAAMKSSHLVVARLAAQALSRIGRAAVSTLVELLQSGDAFVRREAAWALGQVGPAALSENAPPPLPSLPCTDETLPETRNHKTPVIHITEREVIAEWHGPATPQPRSDVPLPDALTALATALCDGDAKVRHAAAHSIRRIRHA